MTSLWTVSEDSQRSGKKTGNDDLKQLFHPRHVSPWCMSKRKRFFDLVLSLTLLIFFLPLMLFVYLLIKTTSEGPALFRQERVGLNQIGFVIFKFRTMRVRPRRAGSGLTVTRHGDSRMTEVGAVLRRLKLDELPQLINVLRGEMSFVGPRPKLAEHEHLCMLCRPGITGAATVEFSNEEGMLHGVPDEAVEGYVVNVLNPEKCRLDIEYMETANFASDLKIMFRTVFKLGNRSRSARPLDPARFQRARHEYENAALRVFEVERVEALAEDVRQSA
ncbi:MAG: sugar transferase [Acidobacteriaceae bacterium]